MKVKPTDSELEILQILWADGACSVRHVFEKLQAKKEKEIGYTTILKLMQLMAEKQLVNRNTDQRTHIYTSNINEKKTQEHLLQRFINQTFRGSAGKMVMQALGNHDASPEELDEIKALIDKMEQKRE